MGYCFVCIPCMIDELGCNDSPWYLTEQPQYRKDDANRTCHGCFKYVDGKMVKCKPTECPDQSYEDIKKNWKDKNKGKSYKQQMMLNSFNKKFELLNDKIQELTKEIEKLKSDKKSNNN